MTLHPVVQRLRRVRFSLLACRARHERVEHATQSVHVSRGAASTQALHVERALIGSLLLAPEDIGPVSTIVTPDDFASPAHRIIYATVLDLSTQDRAGYLALADELDAMGLLERVGGRAYLLTLAAATPLGYDMGLYAEIIAQQAAQRRATHPVESAGEEPA